MTSRSKAIDNISSEVVAAFSTLSAKALNWQPAANRWSIAQILEYLIKINESYFPLVQQLREQPYRPPWYARFSFVPRLMGNLILKAVQPAYPQKTKTFPIWQPAQGCISADILARFLEHQQALKTLMDQNQDLVQKGLLIPSPANKNIVYPLKTAFDMLLAHEQRHLQQAKAVLAAMPAQQQAI